MAIENPKLVLWCGNAANQKALANKIAREFTIAGIVIDEQSGSISKRKWSKIPALLLDRIRFWSLHQSWKDLMTFYKKKYPAWPQVNCLRVKNINSQETGAFTKDINPDLIVVSGTGLVKQPLLNSNAEIGIINLHTGLSPYVKGAPNCTNWCIAKNNWHLVGNTIMWLNAGIDAGNLIVTETVDIRDTKNFLQAHIRVMEHAHELYIKAIRYLLQSKPPYPSVPQQKLGKGELYLNKMWTSAEKKQLYINWKKRHKAELNGNPETVSLPLEKQG